MNIFNLFIFFLFAPKLKDPSSVVDISKEFQVIAYSDAIKTRYPNAKTLEDIRRLVSEKYVNADAEMPAEDLNQFLANLECNHAGVIYKIGLRIMPSVHEKLAKIYISGTSLTDHNNVVIFGGRFDGITSNHIKMLRAIKLYMLKKYKTSNLVVILTLDSTPELKQIQTQEERAVALQTIPYIDIIMLMFGPGHATKENEYLRIIRETGARECIVCEGDKKTLAHCKRHRKKINKIAKKDRTQNRLEITILPRII